MKQKITLKKIAKEFGVSISTVSKALKDSHEISSEVKEKIQAFAKYYHYKPNSLALNLRNQKTKTIGVIIPEIVHHFFTKVITGIEKLANEKGYNVMICLSNESYEKEVLNLDMLANGVVDGIIASVAKETESKEDYRHFTELINNGIPLVMFDRVVDEIECNKVIADDKGGAFLATEQLIKNGCSNIALVTTPDYVTVGLERKEGYLKALKEFQIPENIELIVTIDDQKSIEDQLSFLFRGNNIPDGIFAVNEIYAATVMKVARKFGYSVPEDVEVIGFTDGLISEFTSPSLTTVAQHGRSMGQKALELLLDEIDSQEAHYQYKTNLIQTDLKIRNSTKKVQLQN
ncbi:MAG: LacI family DNA-binding transcriptional regulator [Flavobacteriaceae bacterium]|nr:MAG: LacI family DNA-binding transcriptional regulator [Flavobacteriaceae bacterium]